MKGYLAKTAMDDKEIIKIKDTTLLDIFTSEEDRKGTDLLAIQASLKQINAQIEDVGRDVKSIGEFVRRETLSNKFLCARDKIMSAASALMMQNEKNTCMRRIHTLWKVLHHCIQI